MSEHRRHERERVRSTRVRDAYLPLGVLGLLFVAIATALSGFDREEWRTLLAGLLLFGGMLAFSVLLMVIGKGLNAGLDRILGLNGSQPTDDDDC